MSDVRVPPRAAVYGVVGGLFLMAAFTVGWTAFTFAAWPAAAASTVTAVAVAAGVCFVVRGVQLIRARRRFPDQLSEADRAYRKRTGRSFGLIFGIEGVTIWLASTLLGVAGYDDFIVPVIAVIVGLHFYPLARIFGRRLDLYLATWTTLVGLAGVIVLAVSDLPAPQVWVAVAIGVALATTTYGIYFFRQAGELLARAA